MIYTLQQIKDGGRAFARNARFLALPDGYAETPYADLTDAERLAVDEAASFAISSLAEDGALPDESTDDSDDAAGDILTALARYVLARRVKSADAPRPHDADCARRTIGWAECTCAVGKAQAAEG
jgi:serine/threonine protein kinase HipA of HipAB toxin-antitoxin module